MYIEKNRCINILIMVILTIIIGIYIWMYIGNASKNYENMEVQYEKTKDQQFIIVRVHHIYTKSGDDTFFAFPYDDATYEILKNMHNKTLAFYADKIPDDFPAISNNFYTNIFHVKKCNKVIYCDHEKLENKSLTIANELKNGTKYRIKYITNCIGNNNDFYIRLDY